MKIVKKYILRDYEDNLLCDKPFDSLEDAETHANKILIDESICIARQQYEVVNGVLTPIGEPQDCRIVVLLDN